MSAQREGGTPISITLEASLLICAIIAGIAYLAYELGSRGYRTGKHTQASALQDFTRAITDVNKLPSNEAYRQGYLNGYIDCTENVETFVHKMMKPPE